MIGYDHGGVGEILRRVYPAGLTPLGDLERLTERVKALLTAAPPVPQNRCFPGNECWMTPWRCTLNLRRVAEECSMKLAPAGRTLIVQPLPGIGDMVWHLPHIHAIAATTATGQVDILTKPRSQADRLLCADPCVDRILWVERESGRHAGIWAIFRLAALLRQGTYQRVWILHGSARYALAAWLAGIPERIGYGVGGQSWLLNVPVRLPVECRHAHPTVRADALLDLLDIPRTESEPRLPVSAAAEQAVLERFADWPRPWIALGIGSSEPWKQWGAARFAELALALQHPPAGSIFIVGGPAERSLGDEILRLVRRGRRGGGRDCVATGTNSGLAGALSRLHRQRYGRVEYGRCLGNAGAGAVRRFAAADPFPLDSRHHSAGRTKRDGGDHGCAGAGRLARWDGSMKLAALHMMAPRGFFSLGLVDARRPAAHPVGRAGIVQYAGQSLRPVGFTQCLESPGSTRSIGGFAVSGVARRFSADDSRFHRSGRGIAHLARIRLQSLTLLLTLAALRESPTHSDRLLNVMALFGALTLGGLYLLLPYYVLGAAGQPFDPVTQLREDNLPFLLPFLLGWLWWYSPNALAIWRDGRRDCPGLSVCGHRRRAGGITGPDRGTGGFWRVDAGMANTPDCRVGGADLAVGIAVNIGPFRKSGTRSRTSAGRLYRWTHCAVAAGTGESANTTVAGRRDRQWRSRRRGVAF